MRLPCFQRYITNEETRDVILKDCDVVVEGQTFFFDSYEHANLISTFGPETNAYAQYLKKKLEIFKKANIKCHFIFSSVNKIFLNQKIRATKYDRDLQTIKYNSSMFSNNICLQVLEEEGIKYSICVQEDRQSYVATARKLNCPILADSPMLYFNQAPYILIRTLEYMPSNNYIKCKLYKINNFLTKHQLTKNKFAIFAALTDIELFPPNYFDDLFKIWFVYHKFIIIQYKRLIEWLSKHSENKITSYVTNYLANKAEINKFIDYVEDILKNMQNIDQENVVADHLYDNLKLSVCHQDPLWFAKGVAAGNIMKPYTQLFKIKFLEGSRILDDNNPNDCIMLSIDIIKYVYNLLTNYERNGSFTLVQPAGKPVQINTEDLNIKKPKYECKVTVFENGWGDIKQLKLFEHFLIENNINIDKIEEVPRDARMLLIALAYFTRRKLSADINVTKEVYCCIVSYVILEYEIYAQEGLVKYFKCDLDEAKQIFDADTLKPLEELYYCLLHMNYLNTLCGAPYIPTKYHKTLNGTFIYKLLRDMSSSDCEPNEFVQSLFVSSPFVLSVINDMITLYQELF